jgi:hypothetical protein
MRILLVLMMSMAVTFASCGGDDSPAPDAAGSGSGSAAACTGAVYDPCNPAAPACMSGLMCKTFNGSSFSVCTQTCGTCPAGGTCNNMGICKPAAPNNCTLP